MATSSHQSQEGDSAEEVNRRWIDLKEVVEEETGGGDQKRVGEFV